ncbi:hypothetical protein DFH09DRAFT_1097038 [Mycena vulgaris]|nr:hypothetical protein DFH09DRAFT_1097038 [Mycena vulgaris]
MCLEKLSIAYLNDLILSSKLAVAVGVTGRVAIVATPASSEGQTEPQSQRGDIRHSNVAERIRLIRVRKGATLEVEESDQQTKASGAEPRKIWILVRLACSRFRARDNHLVEFGEEVRVNGRISRKRVISQPLSHGSSGVNFYGEGLDENGVYPIRRYSEGDTDGDSMGFGIALGVSSYLTTGRVSDRVKTMVTVAHRRARERACNPAWPRPNTGIEGREEESGDNICHEEETQTVHSGGRIEEDGRWMHLLDTGQMRKIHEARAWC